MKKLVIITIQILFTFLQIVCVGVMGFVTASLLGVFTQNLILIYFITCIVLLTLSILWII